jgi:hypothetical protein
LRYLVATMEDHDFVGVGGPNLPPADAAMVAKCVAASPGGPIHVLLSDTEAEHIPGCNMAFRTDALEAIGGFDPQFCVAGDDVDICWRLRDAGETLGFSPAALVWHQPRNSVRAFMRQQRGYGAAEGLLERKWPHRYGTDGHARWQGRLYGHGLSTALGRWRVYYGTWGSQPFQALYGPPPSGLSMLAARPEWHLVLASLACLSAAGLWWTPLLAAVPLLVAAVALTVVPAARASARASFMRARLPRSRRWTMWALTTFLHLAQPVARLRGRARLPAWRRATPRPSALPVTRTIEAWSERWRAPEDRLSEIEEAMSRDGVPVVAGGDFHRWDLQARGGLLGAARLTMGLEEHGGGRQLVRFRIGPSTAPLARLSVAALLAGSIAAELGGARAVGLALAFAAGTLAIGIARECGRAVGAFLAHVRICSETTTEPAPSLNGKRTERTA